MTWGGNNVRAIMRETFLRGVHRVQLFIYFGLE